MEGEQQADERFRTNNRDVLGLALIGVGCVVAGRTFVAVGNPGQLNWLAFGAMMFIASGMYSLMTSDPVLKMLTRFEEEVENVRS